MGRLSDDVVDVAVEKAAALSEKISAQMLTRAGAFGYHSNRMALLLVVVSTETMDLTRESESFRTTANVAESSSLRTCVRQTDETNRVRISTRRR